MESYSAALLASLATTSLSAQQIDTAFGSSRILLDSGTVVRFHWKNGSEKARLLTPLEGCTTMTNSTSESPC